MAVGIIIVCYLAWRGATNRPIVWPWKQAEHQRQLKLKQELENLAREPFFQSLSKERQEQVREAASMAQMQQDQDSQYKEKVGLKQTDKVYDVDGVLLRPDELEFLRRHKLVLEPSWPGYKTYRGHGGIYVLVPEPAPAESEADTHDDDSFGDHF